jgi:hypothetical protein
MRAAALARSRPANPFDQVQGQIQKCRRAATGDDIPVVYDEPLNGDPHGRKTTIQLLRVEPMARGSSVVEQAGSSQQERSAAAGRDDSASLMPFGQPGSPGFVAGERGVQVVVEAGREQPGDVIDTVVRVLPGCGGPGPP